MMDLLVQDFSYSAIVSDLNEKGFRTRAGQPWNRVAVFNMMPRLIEIGPRLFSSEEWETRPLSPRPLLLVRLDGRKQDSTPNEVRPARSSSAPTGIPITK